MSKQTVITTLIENELVKSVFSVFSMASIFFSFVNEAYMIMSLKQRKRKRFKDNIEPQQIKPYILSS